MIRVCANCEKEGRGDDAVLGESEPLADTRTTHGICGEHATKTMADAFRNSSNAAAIERYITWPALYEEHGEGG